MHESRSSNCQAERDAQGRFLPGWAGGPGRPPKARERAYQEAVYAACSTEDWEAIAARAVDDALAGDARARHWLSDHLIGDPHPTIDVRFVQGLVAAVSDAFHRANAYDDPDTRRTVFAARMLELRELAGDEFA